VVRDGILVHRRGNQPREIVACWEFSREEGKRMGPIVLHLGHLSISSYAALIGLGVILGLVITYLEARWRGADVVRSMDAALWALVAGIIGGRAAYVAIYWPYFSSHPREIFSLSQGGLAFQGAFVSGVLGLLIYSLWTGTSFWRLADTVAAGLALGQSVGWIGCLCTGCGYGLVTRGSLAYDLRDIYGIMAYRYPTQIMISLLNLAIFVLIFVMARLDRRQRLAPGLVAALYLALNSAGLFFLEFLRADETLYLGTLRWSQIVEALECAVALLTMAVLWARRKRAANVQHSSST
jgi:phosphatidylglycerol:prolipoprotein diacylglycerol transferase